MTGPLFELSLFGVYDPGVPNVERVVVRANAQVNMGQYALIVGMRAHGQDVFPFRDNFFWFGTGMVQPGDWIFVFTGPGEARVTQVPNSQEKIYSVHWGRPKIMFNHYDIIPSLIRLDAFQLAPTAPLLSGPQGSGNTQTS